MCTNPPPHQKARFSYPYMSRVHFFFFFRVFLYLAISSGCCVVRCSFRCLPELSWLNVGSSASQESAVVFVLWQWYVYFGGGLERAFGSIYLLVSRCRCCLLWRRTATSRRRCSQESRSTLRDRHGHYSASLAAEGKVKGQWGARV